MFPLWGVPTRLLAEELLSAGLEAYISSVDLKKLPSRFAGQEVDPGFNRAVSPGNDPCGENGEIHTVVIGAIFLRTVPVRIGEVVKRNGFAYADIIPMD